VNATQGVPARNTQVDSGFYVGVAADSTASLVWIDWTTHRGRMYEAFGSTALCDVRLDTGLVQFGTEEYLSAHYAFTGRPTPEGFAGRLDLLTGNPRDRDSADVVFRRVPVRFNSSWNGVYRDVAATEEHLYGHDLLLLDATDGVVGIVVKYEGGPFTPRSVSIARAGDSLLVSWGIDQMNPAWAHVVRDTLVFNPDWKMPRASDLRSLLVDAGSGSARCREFAR